ncbi:MAG: LysR family transcriptional regulator [Halopseudomonas aestusnigri]
MNLFSEKLLRTFCKVVEHGGFSGAQYELGISQPAISCHIRDLETILGYRLCERGRSGFHLTERGHNTYEKCKKILIQFENFETELIGLRDVLQGSLRIGVVDAHLSNDAVPLSAAIQKFFDRDNDIQLELKVASPSELELELINGTLHLAIGPFTQTMNGLNYHYISSETHFLYCGEEHPLFCAAPIEITPKTLRDHNLCHRTYNTHSGIELLEGKGQTALVSNMEAQASLIMSGKFLGALPDHYARPWVEQGKLRALEHEAFVWKSDFQLATRTSSTQRNAISLFTKDFLSLISGSVTS